MDRAESNNRKRIGSVKDAVNLYGERITEGKTDLRKTQMAFSEAPSRARELHLAKRDLGRFNESKTIAENVKAQAESELHYARKTVKDLTLRIEESKSIAKAKKGELETFKKSGNREDEGSYQYAQVIRELELVKRELSKLKLDMASILEAKSQADKEMEASTLKLRSNLSSVEALRKEIEAAEEEQVLVELARIEAVREFKVIEAQKSAEATQFSFTMEKTQKRINDVIQEIDHSKEIETKLAITTSDVDVLQNELTLVKAMGKRSEKNETAGETEVSKRREEDLRTSTLLQSTKEELEAAKKELTGIREEGFQFMASMDVIRDELKHVTEETARLKKLEEKEDITVQNLNSKLVRAKFKLESVTAAEEKAKAIVSNLSATLQQLTAEAAAAKKERELIIEEATSIRAETQKTEREIDLTEERLQAALQELEAVKASEEIALGNLKTLTEKTMKTRASAAQHNSYITISNFEYKYLSRHAEGVDEIADMKVAAAQAWIEALKASEKEILMKTEVAHRELRELKVVEDQEVYKKEKPSAFKLAAEGEVRKLRQPREKHTEGSNVQVDMALSKKSIKDNGNSTPMRRGTTPRRLSSPGARYVNHSGSISLKKKTKVMPNLVKFFNSKRTEKDL